LRRLLWEALIELQDRRGQSVFSGLYRWHYFYWRNASFDALFIRQLNEASWVPDADGDLQPPSSILFESLGWTTDPFLLSKIHFKKPIVEELAREAGIEPSVLDTLKKYGLTSLAELMARLNIDDLVPETSAGEGRSSHQSEGAGTQAATKTIIDNRGALAAAQTTSTKTGDGMSLFKTSNGASHAGPETSGNQEESQNSSQARSPKSGLLLTRDDGARTFVSYVATHPVDDEEGPDPDGLDHAERLALEARAIEFIRSREPLLKPMPAGNKGFDLIETDSNDEPERWIEVKAMKGSLENRPVGLSSVQFEFARQHGEQYWLYVVEYAGHSERSRIIKINNPAGRAGTFTFDKGWTAIAVIDGASKRRREQ